jgi:phosphoglycolate phosphatase-like HAD superfamily hydrolase
LAQGGYPDLPTDVEKTEDPFDVFRYAATLGKYEACYVEAALRAHEVEAIVTAEPTPGAHELLRGWHRIGRRLAIVSNNSQLAVTTYLDQHRLDGLVHCVAARLGSVPSELEPSPFLLQVALNEVRVEPQRAVLVGDSVTDVQVATSAHSVTIGYANKPGKRRALAAQRPALVVSSMTAIRDAVEAVQSKQKFR